MNTIPNTATLHDRRDHSLREGAGASPAIESDTERLIGRKGFSALVFTQFLGAFNDNLYKMIVSLLAVGAAIEVGSVGAYLSAASIVFILPYLLFSGYAGFIADRIDKRTVLIAGKVFEIAVMAMAFAALVIGRIEFLFATLFLMAVQSTFYSPAKYGILPETLPATLLSRANGVLEMSRYIAVILGTVAISFSVPEASLRYENINPSSPNVDLAILQCTMSGSSPLCASMISLASFSRSPLSFSAWILNGLVGSSLLT